jgi:hypothetical protein
MRADRRETVRHRKARHRRGRRSTTVRARHRRRPVSTRTPGTKRCRHAHRSPRRRHRTEPRYGAAPEPMFLVGQTEGSGAGWPRGIRQRARVTPLALLARSHLTCPYVNQFVGPPPSLCTNDRTGGYGQRQAIYVRCQRSLRMAASTSSANSLAIGAGRSSLPSRVCTRAASVMLDTSQTPCAAKRSAGRRAR